MSHRTQSIPSSNNFPASKMVGALHGMEMQKLIFEIQDKLPVYYFLKLAIERLLACLIFLVLSPLILSIALVVRSRIGAPVFYKHLRVGENMKPFWAYKFRTMNENSLKVIELGYLPLTKIKNDPRVAGKLGAFLRKWKWDELPQLYNVIRGEMTLIGPRPYTFDESLFFSSQHYVRFAVRPGMSGLWQARSRDMNKPGLKTRFDCFYARKLSLKMDLWIWVRTFYILVRGERF